MLRVLIDGRSKDDWDRVIPYAVWAWRTTPQPSLGGYSPYRIVTGMQPRTPFAFSTNPVGRVRVDISDYVKDIVDVYERTVSFVRRFHEEYRTARETAQARSSRTGEFAVGDFVLVLRPEFLPQGRGHETVSKKLLYKVFDKIYQVSHKISSNTYILKDPNTAGDPVEFSTPMHLIRMIPASTWYISDTDGSSGENTRRLDIRSGPTTRRATVLGFGYDGQVQIIYEGAAEVAQWGDLTKLEYEWVA